MSQSQEHGLEPDSLSGNSPGQALREAREKFGLSVEEVASELNLSVSQIHALEENRFEALPGKTYVQGYLKSYARLLNSDESDVLQNFSHQEDANTSGLRPVMRDSDSGGRSTKIMGLGAVLISAALLFVWWQNREPPAVVSLEVGELEQEMSEPAPGVEGWPQPFQSEQITAEGPIESPGNAGQSLAIADGTDLGAATETGSEPADETESAEAESVQVTGAASGTEGEGEPSVADSVESAAIDTALSNGDSNAPQAPAAEPDAANAPTEAQSRTAPTADTSAPSVASVDAVMQNAPDSSDQTEASGSQKKIEVASTAEPAQATPQAEEAAAQTPNAAGAGGLVKLTFKADSWVDLRDANGRRLLYENMAEGREISVQGNPPFSVFLGNAPGVEIDYDGRPFDFSAFTNGVYARFELGKQQRN